MPFTVTVIIPFIIFDSRKIIFTGSLILAKIAGVLIFMPALSLFIYTVYLFKNFGNGTLAPWEPTQKLVIRGPYKYCRNPMISAVLFILTGETLFFNSFNHLIWAVIFFIMNTVYFIVMEEPDLLGRFGDDYERYKKNVPRWIPAFKPYEGG